MSTGEGSTAFLREAIVGMADIADENGQPIVYSEDLRDQLIAVPYVRGAIARTYFTAIAKGVAGN
jgi:hypothetical protein